MRAVSLLVYQPGSSRLRLLLILSLVALVVAATLLAFGDAISATTIASAPSDPGQTGPFRWS
jgi:hypothetical protein